MLMVRTTVVGLAVVPFLFRSIDQSIGTAGPGWKYCCIFMAKYSHNKSKSCVFVVQKWLDSLTES